jgi:hypothetical protein
MREAIDGAAHPSDVMRSHLAALGGAVPEAHDHNLGNAPRILPTG